MSDGDVSCIAPAAKCMFIDPLQTSHARIVLETATKPTRFARIGQGANPLHPPATKCPLNVRKWSENVMFLAFWLRSVFRAPTTCTFEHYFQKCWCVLNILTSKRALRHKGVHLWTSQLTVLRTWCVLHLLTSKCAWGRMACTFSTSQLPKMLRTRHFFTLWTSKCALRHNGVHVFISHLITWLRTRRVSEPTFLPSGAPKHTPVFRYFS